MMLNHAVALAECRSYLAALADTALNNDAFLDYHGVLLELDWLHGGNLPPVTPVPTENRRVVYQLGQRTLSQLHEHGLDPFSLAMCQCMLSTAWEREHSR